MSNRFDFTVAEALCDAVNKASNLMEKKSEDLETRFQKLHEFFKDDAYENLSQDMSAANRSVDNVIQQMRDTAKHIGQYAQHLKDAY